MQLRRVRLSRAFKQAGLNLEEALGATAAVVDEPTVWLMVTPVADCRAELEGSRFFKSIASNVDDDEKRSNFSSMIHGLFRAANQGDYAGALSGLSIKCKVAHSFSYARSVHKLWELKQGKKDRLYFYPLNRTVAGKDFRCIVLIAATHKNSQTTPDDIKSHSESVIRSCLDPRGMLSICQEPS